MEGRIIKGVGGRYLVTADGRDYDCTARGIFRKRNIVPTVGDLVVIETKGDSANIIEIRERKNQLVRPRVANVDTAMLVFAAANPAIDFSLCDKLIILAEAAGVEPLIVVNKIDLNEDYSALTRDYASIGYAVFAVSAVKEDIGAESFECLKRVIAGKVSAFAGPSGVGKSSIINRLLSYTKMETGELSQKISRGKHTTRHAELISTGDSGYVIDTPGFSSLETDGVKREELPGLFREFREFLGTCRFNDCRHINEPDCTVKENVGGKIPIRRYRQYVEMYNSPERG